MIIRKLTSLILLTLFICVQSLSLVHAAEHGSHHDHGGVKCDICLSADYKQLINFNGSDSLIPEVIKFKISLIKASAFISNSNSSFKSRAPPTFS